METQITAVANNKTQPIPDAHPRPPAFSHRHRHFLSLSLSTPLRLLPLSLSLNPISPFRPSPPSPSLPQPPSTRSNYTVSPYSSKENEEHRLRVEGEKGENENTQWFQDGEERTANWGKNLKP